MMQNQSPNSYQRGQQMRQNASCAQPSCQNETSTWSRMSQEQLLRQISLLKFAMVDANLYLDTHPDDKEALHYFQKHTLLYNEAMEEYAKKYGPLTLAHAHHCDGYWNWVNQPWPWQ